MMALNLSMMALNLSNQASIAIVQSTQIGKERFPRPVRGRIWHTEDKTRSME